MPQIVEEVHIWDVGQAANKARSLLAKLHPSHCERAFYPSRVLAWAQCKFRMYKSASFIHICTKLLQYKAVNLQKQEHMCRRYVDEDRAMPTLYDKLWGRSCQQWHVRFSDRRLVRVSCPPCFCLYFFAHRVCTFFTHLPTVFLLFQNQRIRRQWQTQYGFDIEVNLLFWEEKCDH